MADGDKPMTKSDLAAATAELATKSELQALREEMATKSEVQALRDDMAKMNERFNSMEQMMRDMQSQLRGVQLSGEIVPPPTDGVVNPEEDNMLLHRQTTATRRYKGAGVVCVFVAKRRAGKSRKFE